MSGAEHTGRIVEFGGRGVLPPNLGGVGCRFGLLALCAAAGGAAGVAPVADGGARPGAVLESLHRRAREWVRKEDIRALRADISGAASLWRQFTQLQAQLAAAGGRAQRTRVSQ